MFRINEGYVFKWIQSDIKIEKTIIVFSMIHYIFLNEKFNKNLNNDINGLKDYKKEMIEIMNSVN